MLEFRIPEFGDIVEEYNRLSIYGLFPALAEQSMEINQAFMIVDNALHRAFDQHAHLDYDYPLRAALFVRSVHRFSLEAKIMALAYINALLRKDALGHHHGQVIQDMLLISLLGGQMPKTPEEYYAQGNNEEKK